eukprot:gene14663-biopygen23130
MPWGNILKQLATCSPEHVGSPVQHRSHLGSGRSLFSGTPRSPGLCNLPETVTDTSRTRTQPFLPAHFIEVGGRGARNCRRGTGGYGAPADSGRNIAQTYDIPVPAPRPRHCPVTPGRNGHARARPASGARPPRFPFPSL